MTFKQMMKDELNVKGAVKLCLEAVATFAFMGAVIGSMYIMQAIYLSNLAKGM